MLHVMRTKGWKDVRPFRFYMSDMEDKILKVRTELLEMDKLGHLRCKYFVEKNKKMATLMEDMVK